MTLALEHTSLQYVRVPVTADGIDVTADPVAMAFTSGFGSSPQSGDWHDAAWDNGNARILVGPGGDVTLFSGRYLIWVKVTDSPEIPVLRAGYLVVR